MKDGGPAFPWWVPSNRLIVFTGRVAVVTNVVAFVLAGVTRDIGSMALAGIGMVVGGSIARIYHKGRES